MRFFIICQLAIHNGNLLVLLWYTESQNISLMQPSVQDPALHIPVNNPGLILYSSILLFNSILKCRYIRNQSLLSTINLHL